MCSGYSMVANHSESQLLSEEESISRNPMQNERWAHPTFFVIVWHMSTFETISGHFLNVQLDAAVLPNTIVRWNNLHSVCPTAGEIQSLPWSSYVGCWNLCRAQFMPTPELWLEPWFSGKLVFTTVSCEHVTSKWMLTLQQMWSSTLLFKWDRLQLICDMCLCVTVLQGASDLDFGPTVFYYEVTICPWAIWRIWDPENSKQLCTQNSRLQVPHDKKRWVAKVRSQGTSVARGGHGSQRSAANAPFEARARVLSF